MSAIRITSTRASTAQRYAAIREVRQKRAFWRHVSVYTVLNLAFWVSWIIAGMHERWIAPWPLLPTVVWGIFVLAHEYRLGGPAAISHDTIAAEVYQLTHPDEPVYTERPVQQQIRYGDMSALTPIRPFHYRQIIDARDATRVADEAAPDEHPANASTNL